MFYSGRMLHQEQQLQRRARTYLAQGGTVPLSAGWKTHNADHVRSAALTPIPYDLVDALTKELIALGLQPFTAISPDNTVPAGYFSIACDVPTFDGTHLDGFSITMAASTFASVMQPALQQWREARGSAKTPS